MTKVIRILEVPIYLLVMAMGCYEAGASGTAIFLVLVSIFANTISDDSVYK